MSVKALTWAFDQPIAGNEKVVLLALADHANERGICWPSISLLMQRANVGERTVQRAIQSLEVGGYITRERRQRDNGGDTSNLYRLMLEKVSQSVSACTSVDQRGSGGVNLAPPPIEGGVTQTGGEGVTQTGGEGVTQTVPNRTVRKNRNIEPSNILFDSDFDEFWAAFPKRTPHPNPKKKAKEKYINLRKQNVSHETIVNAARNYALLRRGEDPMFTVMAVTWLNQHRFDDDQFPLQASVPIEDIRKLIASYPVVEGSEDFIERAATSCHPDEIGDIIESAKKYTLLVKQWKAEGFTPPLPTLIQFVKYKWRDMLAYEFCRVGMNNTLSVRPKKKG